MRLLLSTDRLGSMLLPPASVLQAGFGQQRLLLTLCQQDMPGSFLVVQPHTDIAQCAWRLLGGALLCCPALC